MAAKHPGTFETGTNRPIRRFQNVINDSGVYTLIWLKKNFDADDESIEVQKKLKQAINQVKVFDDLDECVDYLTDLVHQKVIFIVSDTFGRTIVPIVNDFPQMKTIYIYSFDKAGDGWEKEYEKVRSSFLFHLTKYY